MQKQQENSPLPPVDYAQPEVEQLLQHSIRTQLESLLKSKITTDQRQQLLQKSFTDAISLVLTDSKVEHAQLLAAFETMYDHAVQSLAQTEISEALLTRQFISETGLVMSPFNCKHTIKDVYRIKGYARGLHNAIQAVLQRKDSITILYPACGPFAPLLLPLLSYYKANQTVNTQQIKLILLDMHPGAIISLKQLVDDLQLNDFVTEIIEADATKYVPETTVDLLVLEAMQHGFSKEGQLSIAKHLVQFLAVDGWLIPQNVSVRAAMIIGETEYNQQWKDAEYAHSNNTQTAAQQDRIELGEILRVNKSTLAAMETLTLGEGQQVIKGNLIQLPAGVPDMKDRILAIYAHIDTFNDEAVGQYDSGITHPKPDMHFYVDAQPKEIEHTYFTAKGGDSVLFFYQLNGLPGFVPVKVEG
ncbi:hypothetical protein ACSLBF_18785 (plasmid) [Pseudoalteromonas sp. T1lg65]|uniref:hypothetical protein n=1 Tax=Pseudoalteromonas sp. T1lg65 TaxID=2077101 RepID=UPI003F7B0DBB